MYLHIYIMVMFLFHVAVNPTISDLIDHLQSKHRYQVEIQTADFPDMVSFLSWKEKEEKRNVLKLCAAVRSPVLW